VETIPGISAFNAAASLAQIPLVEGKERLAILPVTDDLRPLREAFREFDTVVLMKVGSKLERVVRLLDELNLIKNAVLVSHAGCPNEYIERDLSILSGKELGYLSVIIVRCREEKA
jgi:precorrin-2/cobalt-factor-2 C20-methyltransferase